MAGEDTRILGGPRPFPETSWNAIRQSQSEALRRQALDGLLRRYWGPIYFYVRRHWAGDVEEAKDLTQAFFTAFLEKDWLATVDADKGRFRNFLLVALRHFLAKVRRAERAAKRRPAEGVVSLDGLPGERLELAGADDPDVLTRFNAEWKQAVVRTALETLRKEARPVEKEVYVELLIRYDLDREPGETLTYQQLAEQHGLTVSQVTNGLHWARKAYRAAFCAELREQVAGPEELAREALELFGIELTPAELTDD